MLSVYLKGNDISYCFEFNLVLIFPSMYLEIWGLCMIAN